MDLLMRVKLEKQIHSYKEQIEFLKRDMQYVKYQISVDAIQHQISEKESTIKDIQRDLEKWVVYELVDTNRYKPIQYDTLEEISGVGENYTLLLNDSEARKFSVVETFKTRQEGIDYILKNFKGNFAVIDEDYRMNVSICHIDDKIDYSFNFDFGFEFNEKAAMSWGWQPSEEDEDQGYDECSSCGGGGCPDCEPQRHINVTIND